MNIGISRVACLAVFMAAAPLASSAQAEEQFSDMDTTVIYGGIDVTEGSVFGYLGAVYAFQGLGQDGWAVKGSVGGGAFSYDAFRNQGSSDTTEVDGESITFDASVGYRAFHGDWQFGAFVGVDYWDVDQPEELSSFVPLSVNVRGDEFGVQFDLEATHNPGNGHYFDIRGNYSTAFDTYWGRARYGYQFANVLVGPEGAVLGNEDYDAVRGGAFARFNLPGSNINVEISGGVADTTGSGPDSASDGTSAYGAAGFSVVY